MPDKKSNSVNDLPKMYNFVLNPYPDQSMWRCPFCNLKTGQRKRPLFIHIDPHYPVALNYTCRYCRQCDLLIAQKHKIERLLTNLFAETNPAIIGNAYLIMGTVEKKAWREGLKEPKNPSEVLSNHFNIFKTVYNELRMTRPGWYRDGVEPPELPPPPSTEWVKDKDKKQGRK